MLSPGVVPGQSDVAEVLLSLGLAAHDVALRPHPGGAELSGLGRDVGERSEGREGQSAAEVVGETEVGIEVEFALVVLLGEHGLGWVYAVGGLVFGPCAGGVAARRIGGVLASGRVEEGLCVEDVTIVGGGAEHAELSCEPSAEGGLCGIEFGHEIVVALGADDGVVSDVADGGAVVGCG